jgi:hypothetical protein
LWSHCKTCAVVTPDTFRIVGHCNSHPIIGYLFHKRSKKNSPLVGGITFTDRKRLQLANFALRFYQKKPRATFSGNSWYVLSLPPLEETPNNPLLARIASFSLQAATVCEAQPHTLSQGLGSKFQTSQTHRAASVNATSGL